MLEAETAFVELAVSLGLGLLVGLQRQRTGDLIAGVRTFPMVTLLGALAALLSRVFGGWVLGLGLVALAGVIVVANVVSLRRAEPTDPGMTTEVAMLLMYAVGAYLIIGSRAVGVALGGGVAVLLQLKEPLHRMARRIGDADFRAITQFVLISLVILPLLPDRALGPYAVLNPRQIGLMVVLIVGIGLAGYLSFKLFGEGAGTALSGFLGGLISSTATTAGYARRGREEEGRRQASAVIMIASAVVFARVLVELAVVAPEVLPIAGPPLACMLGLMAVLAFIDWTSNKPSGSEAGDYGNPSELRSALLFGLLYALVLFVVAVAKERFGTGALYGVAILSGLTDMDAITLSTSQLMRSGRLAVDTGWRLILVASMSNLGFKLAVIMALGGKRLAGRVGAYYALALGAGGGLLLLWPG